jgi:hypothetical protein
MVAHGSLREEEMSQAKPSTVVPATLLFAKADEAAFRASEMDIFASIHEM